MPHLGNPFQKGDLYLKFEVVFPEAPLDDSTTKVLTAVLPPSTGHALPDAEAEDVEEVRMKDGLLKEFGAGAGGGSSGAYDEDEQESGGPGVQCAQQ
mmetsp:Transcript_10797/g.16961  ORF Transcript_10797/g.16961 Transcript_10797/m.16961 type:complete len:97 (+) Transcript_10797:1213-1503(+)